MLTYADACCSYLYAQVPADAKAYLSTVGRRRSTFVEAVVLEQGWRSPCCPKTPEEMLRLRERGREGGRREGWKRKGGREGAQREGGMEGGRQEERDRDEIERQRRDRETDTYILPWPPRM
jgi:hypothetical protein